MSPRPLFVPHHSLSAWGCLSVLLLCLPGCPAPPSEDTEVTVSEALAFDPIGWGLQAHLDTTERVIQDADTWAVYQDSLRPLRPFKKVDFTQEMVLLAAVPVTTGGYSLQFEVVEQDEQDITARYLLSIPADDCRTTVGAGVVFQAVRLARTEASLSFERRHEPYRCTEPR